MLLGAARDCSDLGGAARDFSVLFGVLGVARYFSGLVNFVQSSLGQFGAFRYFGVGQDDGGKQEFLKVSQGSSVLLDIGLF